MDLNIQVKKIVNLISKYRYPVLILVIGIALMMIPVNKKEEVTSIEQTEKRESICSDTAETDLEQILSSIAGAGKVQVYLSISSGEEIIYQMNEDTSASDTTSTTQITTVLTEQSDKSNSGLVRQINPPEYLGAIISCQGADSAAVRLAIVDAVSKVTGLGADRISILKMK